MKGKGEHISHDVEEHMAA